MLNQEHNFPQGMAGYDQYIASTMGLPLNTPDYIEQNTSNFHRDTKNAINSQYEREFYRHDRNQSNGYHNDSGMYMDAPNLNPYYKNNENLKENLYHFRDYPNSFQTNPNISIANPDTYMRADYEKRMLPNYPDYGLKNQHQQEQGFIGNQQEQGFHGESATSSSDSNFAEKLIIYNMEKKLNNLTFNMNVNLFLSFLLILLVTIIAIILLANIIVKSFRSYKIVDG